MASNSHFRCQLKAETSKKDEAELLIYDEIGKSPWGDGIAAKEVVQALSSVTAKKIRVRINSLGGDVKDGLAIYNALRSHGAKIITENDSFACSIASVLFLAGDERKMADNGFLMIHEPHGGEYGTADDMRAMADLLDKVGGGLLNLYVDRTGQDEEQVRDWMEAETWFTAAEAKEAGFVTAITKGKKVEARADLSAFRNVPTALKAQAPAPSEQDADDAVTEETPTAAGGAAPESDDAPITPADQAKGATPMSDQDKATLLASERARVKSIRAIGQEHKIEAALVDAAIDDETTVDAFRAVVLEQIKAKAKAAPQINARVGSPRADKDPARGFGSHVEFFQSVIENRHATSKDAVRDERLKPLAMHDEDEKGAGELAFLMPRAWNPKTVRAAAGSDEQGAYADTYGGFAVPDSTLPGMLSVGFEGDPTLGRTTSIPMATPLVKIIARTDKNHTTSVSGGFTVSRRPETTDFTSSRSKIERVTLEATSLVGLAYETEELLQFSAISFAALIDAGFRDQFAAQILNEKIRGTGAGEYEGILTSASKVQVDKETNQQADTINYKNVLKMRARCWGYGNAIWLANHDCLPELAQMSLAVGTGGAPVFIPGQFGDRPDTLLGRPIFFSEYPNTVGDAGDLILWNPTQYLEGLYQPLQSAESVHVRFVQHERVFKLWLMNAGACWWRSALTPAKGANTLSPIVTLAARA